MRKRVINESSQETTLRATVANVVSLLAIITVPNGTTYKMMNPLQIVTKLLADGGAQIPGNSAIYVAVRRAGSDFQQFLKKIPYRAYFDLSEAQQRDVRYIKSTTHDLGYDMVILRERDQLEFYVESSVAVDPTETGTRLEVEVIEEN